MPALRTTLSCETIELVAMNPCTWQVEDETEPADGPVSVIKLLAPEVLSQSSITVQPVTVPFVPACPILSALEP